MQALRPSLSSWTASLSFPEPASFRAFSEASAHGPHRGEAYFGMAYLYLAKYQESWSPRLGDQVVANLRQCKELELDKDGYVAGEPDSKCPYCYKTFEKKSEDPRFIKLLEELSKK